MKKVSFDFDDTLSYESVQKYAEQLIDLGIEIHITTSRFEDLSKYLPTVWPNGHGDLFEVAKKLYVPNERIHFTNFVDKWEFLKDTDFIWHLDDNPMELLFINQNTKVKGIYSLNGDWIYNCNKLLNIETE